jgi:hypothetical protein
MKSSSFQELTELFFHQFAAEMEEHADSLVEDDEVVGCCHTVE